MIGGVLGNALGVPLVGGFLADQLSAAMGRPLQVDLGRNVFEAEDGSRTYTGGGMTVQDKDNQYGTFLGSSPFLGSFGNGVANAAPSRSTLFGADPAAPEPGPIPEQPAPELPEGVGAPAPIDAGNVSVDPGNSQLTESQLTDLFLNFVGPRSYRGRSRQTVVT